MPPTRTGGPPGRIHVTSVETDMGVKGYSFLGSAPRQIAAAQPVLVGGDLFQIEAHLKNGLIKWGGIEEALWDAIGKIAGEPVSRLLGGTVLPAQLVCFTYVWPGANEQETIAPKCQVEQSRAVKTVRFMAMKIQIFRRNYNLDVEAVGDILGACGPDFRVMVDRTADRSPGSLWSHDQAQAAARANHHPLVGGSNPAGATSSHQTLSKKSAARRPSKIARGTDEMEAGAKRNGVFDAHPNGRKVGL